MGQRDGRWLSLDEAADLVQEEGLPAPLARVQPFSRSWEGARKKAEWIEENSGAPQAQGRAQGDIRICRRMTGAAACYVVVPHGVV